MSEKLVKHSSSVASGVYDADGAEIESAKLRHADSTVAIGSGEPSPFDPDKEANAVQEMRDALTQEESEAIATVASDDNGTRMLIRHFRAEKGNITKAIASVKHAIQWRKEFGVLSLRRCFLEGGDETTRETMLRQNETGKIYVRGYDKHGRAMMYMRPGRENLYGSQYVTEQMQHLVWNIEKAIACTERKSLEITGKRFEKYNLVIDYEGFKISQSPPMSVARQTLDILQKHFPERMHRAYVCNPPFVFRAFWTAVKPFVDPVTKEKVVFCHGKSGLAKIAEDVGGNIESLEPCAGGPAPLRDFDSREYLQLSFDTTFDEKM